MRRIKISELIRETGLSRATIDRALNKRSGIHPRTESVIQDAIDRLNQQVEQPLPTKNQGKDVIPAVLQLGRGLTCLLTDAIDNQCLPVELNDVSHRNEEEIIDVLVRACRDIDTPLIVTVRSNERVNEVLSLARSKGKRIVTLISDLRGDSRDAFVGIDNRMAGQAAAHLIGQFISAEMAPTAGVLLGDYAFNCHEDREIGFRSHLRMHHPKIQLADVTVAGKEDVSDQTYHAVKSLIQHYPGISAIYNVGAGNAGLARALEEHDMAEKVCVISHEADHITVPLLRSGTLNFVIAQDPRTMLSKALEIATPTESGSQIDNAIVDFGIYTRFNIPRFS